jgi:hypothetical protein
MGAGFGADCVENAPIIRIDAANSREVIFIVYAG